MLSIQTLPLHVEPKGIWKFMPNWVLAPPLSEMVAVTVFHVFPGIVVFPLTLVPIVKAPLSHRKIDPG
jgi:hypothetical protein